jgi:hypothetical protein
LRRKKESTGQPGMEMNGYYDRHAIAGSHNAHTGHMSQVQHHPPAAPLHQPYDTALNATAGSWEAGSGRTGFRHSDSGQETDRPNTALQGVDDEETAIYNAPNEDAVKPKNWRVNHYFHSAVQSLDSVSHGHRHDERT